MPTPKKFLDYKQCMNPIVERLRELGGSASLQEIREHVAQTMGVPDEILSAKVVTPVAWALTYLKKDGLLENSSRGVWSLTKKGSQTKSVDARKVAKEVQDAQGWGPSPTERGSETQDDQSPPDAGPASLPAEGPEGGWETELIATLLTMLPQAFEKLCQRILREKGFVEVEVVGRTGDGGIDGVGILRLSLLSFRVVFQCKRWKGSVGAEEIRKFQAAMMGRADKGLFITTSSFTKDAQREATRDGAPAIDLVDGGQLAELLKQLGLGLIIDKAWFSSF